jgi:hypothetical protein
LKSLGIFRDFECRRGLGMVGFGRLSQRQEPI